MKKLFSGATLVVLLSLTMSLFVSNSVQAQNNGVEVVINNTAGTNYLLIYGVKYYSQSQTFQIKDGKPHMATMVFNLPEDCGIIEKRSYSMFYPDSESPMTLRVTPSGMAILKFINNGGDEF